MSKPTSIVDPTGNRSKHIEIYGQLLGRNKMRRRVFNEIYGRVRKPRSVREIATAIGVTGNKSIQPVQNALSYLADHDFVLKMDNDGHTGAAQYVYGKIKFVAANKEQIIKAADNKKFREALSDKSATTVVKNITNVRQPDKRALRKQKPLNILYLTASPDEATHLRVDAEVRLVQEAVRGSPFRDKIKIAYRPAAGLNTLIDGLNDLHPQIIHFSGHGNKGGVLMDKGKVGRPTAKTLSFDLLAQALDATDHPPEVIVLNACNSSAAKKALLPAVKAIIAMGESVTDIAAAVFAQKFYAAIASGQSISSAFKQGKIGVEESSISEKDIPVLLHDLDIDPAKIKLT